MKRRAVLLAIMLVFAGCSGGTPTATKTDTASESPTDTSTQSSTPTSSPTPTATPFSTATPEPTATPLPDAAQNPWGKQNVTVSIVDRAGTGRDYRPLVESALAFWERNASNTTEFEVNFQLVDDKYTADVVVVFVENIDECDEEDTENTIGCADVYDSVGEANSQTGVEIKTGYNNKSTLTILKHEFGHTLGLTHDDTDPTWFMAGKISVGTFPKPDVDERDWKWDTNTVRVYADVEEAADHRHDKLREEVSQTVSSYNNYDHEKIPDNATIKMVDSRETADIVVKVVDETPSGKYSDAELWGYDDDEDGQIEYYSNVTIYIRDEHHDDVGEYAGYWMGWSLYADADRELPHEYRPENLPT